VRKRTGSTEPKEAIVSDRSDFNTRIIEEFRANEGRVGGDFEGVSLLLLTTTGAKTGKPRTNPVAYQQGDDNTVYVFASKGGSPTNPDWYHNLVAHPSVVVERGTDRYDATAEPLTGADRDEIYARQAKLVPQFGGYERTTDRIIPVVALRPAS
jgi:deazaflavin-dependent oxidoreductase (nitroreductase family)